jgi:hypothetical protein
VKFKSEQAFAVSWLSEENNEDRTDFNVCFQRIGVNC